jgi:outer membrane protein insertion porin family
MMKFSIFPILRFCVMTLCVAFLIFAPISAQAQQVVQSIEVSGAQRVEKTTVLSYLGIKEGQAVERGDLDKSLKTLFATGLFADVVLEQKGPVLHVNVVENPVINQIAFEGNDKLESEELMAEIGLRPRQVFTRTKVQSDVTRIYQLYRRNGRFASNIDPKVIQLDQNRVDLVFEIQEGDVTDIRAIRFVGNDKFDDDRLRSEITTKESAWYSFISSSDRYDPDRLAFDQDLLRQFYLSQGYADFELVSAVAELANDREAFFVTFTIDEGQRYKVRDVKIESQIQNLDTEGLKPHVTFVSSDWYSADEVKDTISKMTDALGDLQYAFVNIRPRVERDRENAMLDIVFQIEESPRVFIERVDISGNVRTLDKVIRREMLLVEGDPFNKSKLARSEQNIRDLDFFETVSFEVKPGSAPDKSVINIAVVEKSTGEVSLGAGFSTSDGVIGDVGIRERNLLGKGQDLKFSTVLSADTTRFDVGFVEPYFLNRDVSAGVNLFNRELREQESRRYDEQRTGGNTFLNYPLSENWRQTLKYRLDSSDISNLPSDASLFLLEQEGERTTSAISQRLMYDTRDSQQFPTEGYNFWLETELAGLGFDSKHVSAVTGASSYYSLADKVVLNVLAEGGAIEGYGDENVEINERFSLGGPSSFRGFEKYGVGPRELTSEDDGGGNLFYRGTAEVAFPLDMFGEFGLRGSVFTDVGSLWDIDVETAGVVDENVLRASSGLGITWQSPFGPIGVYYAEPWQKEEYDQVKEFEFNFGTRF